jgi:replicative DNA helicase
MDAQGGMIKGRSYVVGGRTGLGKSWIDLLFVASAVIAGHKFILYPLEMTLTETAFRLYTIFSQKMFGQAQVLKNTDLTHGYVTKAQAVRVLHALEDKFAGQLYVADIGSMSDPYTVDRVDAEVQIYKPDGYWIDYITLMKAPEMKKGGEDYSAIRYLSSGVKGINIRNNVVGGMSAQINREALKVRAFIPRLDHISYGDSIGHDADHVVMINRRGQYLYYAEVKNRHGPEIPTTRVSFFVDEGIIAETEDQSTEGDDDDE